MKAQIREFFPGGNTPYGFHSYYNYISPQKEAEKIFCIKGGPGVGKSTLMKEICQHFIERNESVDLFRCSADPKSLDGVLMRDRRVSVIDGTAPHIIDPINPGAVDEIVELGKYLDLEKLRRNKKSILSCSEKISNTYRQAYAYLKCAAILYDDIHCMTGTSFSDADSKVLIDKLCEHDTKRNNNKGNAGKVKKFFAGAISSSGMVNSLKSLATTAKDIYIFDTPAGCDISHVMKSISDKVTALGVDVIQLYCPMDPRNKIEHILIPEWERAIFTCNDYHGKELLASDNLTEVIEVCRSHDEYKTANYLAMLKDTRYNLNKAVESLKIAKELHDELETYYIDSMDFNGINDIKDYIITTIENLN